RSTCSSDIGRPAEAAAGAPASARAAEAALAVPPAIADSTSAFTTRPCGPEPDTAERSMPASLAIRRASGEAKMRLFDDWPVSPPVGDMAGRPEGGNVEGPYSVFLPP